MNRLGWVFILPFLTACAWSESRVSQQPRTTAPSGITSPTGYFDYLEVLNGGIFNSYGNSTFGNNPNFDKVTMQAYIYGNLVPDASPSTVSLLGTASRPWSAYISAATLNTLYPAGSILSVDGDFEVLNGRTFKSWGDTYIGNHPVFDKLQVNAYIEGNLIPDASPSTVSSLGSDARPWTAKLRDATANNLFVNEYVNIGREDTQRGILRLFGGASNPPVMYWYNSDNVDSPENYWYAYPWGEVFFFYPSTGSPNGFTYTALGQFQCNQASFTQQLYAANIKSSTGTNTFGGNATLGGNTLTAGAVTWTTGTGTFGAAGKTANFPGSVQAAHIKSSTGTNTFGGAVQSTGDHIASGAAVYYRNAADNALVRFSGGTDFNTAHLSIHGDQRTTNPGSTSWWHGGTGGTFDIASTLSLGYITKAAAFNTHMSMDNRGNFAFNTNDLVIDATNNRVGIQKASPAYTLDVDGTLNVTGNVTLGDAAGDTTTITGLELGSVTAICGFRGASGGGYATFNGVTTSSSVGWVAPGTGSIIGVSGYYGGGADTITVRKNGVEVWSAYAPSGWTAFNAYQAKGTDTFTTRDVITLYVLANQDSTDSTYTLYVTLDTFGATGPGP